LTRTAPSNGDLAVVEYRALAEFRYQIRRFLHFSEEQARASGLEPQQHQLLLALKGLPKGDKATIRELSARLQLKHHSTVELVNRLELRGMIKRTPGEKDRREVIIQFTRAGEALLGRLSLMHREQLQSAGPELAKALRTVLKANAPRRRRGKAEEAA
jgi:DNA-binding MarR family transcriptional regulator